MGSHWSLRYLVNQSIREGRGREAWWRIEVPLCRGYFSTFVRRRGCQCVDEGMLPQPGDRHPASPTRPPPNPRDLGEGYEGRRGTTKLTTSASSPSFPFDFLFGCALGCGIALAMTGGEARLVGEVGV